MKKTARVILFVLILNIFTPVFAQEEDLIYDVPKIEWEIMSGGGNYEYYTKAFETENGHYLIVGYSDSNEIDGMTTNGHNNDFYLFEIDANGEIIWQKVIGGLMDDALYSAQKTAEGNYLLLGTTNSLEIDGILNTGLYSYYVVKIDSEGDIIWHTIVGDEYFEFSKSACLADDKGVLITGYHKQIAYGLYDPYDYYAIKLDYEGEVEWQRKMGGSGDDKVVDTVQTKDGSYLLVGSSTSTDIAGAEMHGVQDIYVVKLNRNGDIQWHKMIGGSSLETPIAVYASDDGGSYIIGQSQSIDLEGTVNNGAEDVYILKLSSDGEIIWQKLFGGNIGDIPIVSQRTADGGFVVGGHSNSNNFDEPYPNVFDRDYYVLKVSKTGEMQWQHKYGGLGHENFKSIKQTIDGGFLLSGDSRARNILDFEYEEEKYTEIYVVKLNDDGEILWHILYGGNGIDTAFDAIEVDEQNYLSLGYSTSSDIGDFICQGRHDYYLAKLTINEVIDEYEKYAEDLSEIGVFVGSDIGFELEREATRIEGLIMFIRLIGKEEEVLSKNWEHPFSDVPEWADRHIGWAYQNGYTYGISENEFGTGIIQARSFVTLVLRALGYDDIVGDFSWENSLMDANDVGLINSKFLNDLNQDAFLRKHMARISIDALNCKIKNSNFLLIDQLVDAGVFQKSEIEFLKRKNENQ